MVSVEATPVLDERDRQSESGNLGVASTEPRVSHAAFLTAAQLSRGLVRLLFVVVTARALGPETFGVYALLLATIEMLAVASGSGYMDYLTREAATDERLGWGLAAQLIWLRLACTIPLVGLGLGALWLLHYPATVIVAAAWFSLSLVSRALSEAVQGVLRGTGHYLAFLFVELAFAAGLIAGTVLLLVRGGGLPVVIDAELIATGLAAALAIFFALRFRTRARIHLGLRQLVKTSSIFNIYAFVGNLYDRLDVVLLSRLAGNYATGIYSAAYRPLGTVQLLPYGILFSILPSLSRGKCDGSERERLEKAMGLLLCCSFLIVLVTIAFADSAIPYVLGNRFSEAATALKILIWAVIFRYMNYALNIALLAAGREKVFISTCLVSLAINLVGNVLLIPLYSWRAAAALTIATELVLLGQNIFWTKKVFRGFRAAQGMTRTVLVFGILCATTLLAGFFKASVAAGTTCTLLFLAYLYSSGFLNQIRRIWAGRELFT